jgi:hypothetical protein
LAYALTPLAGADIREIWTYIAPDNRAAADRDPHPDSCASTPFCQIGWVDDAESTEPSKIPYVDGEQLRHAMNVHTRGQARVMDLHALDLERNQKLPPTVMDCSAIRQKVEVSFDYMGDAICLGDAQSEPVLITRPGRSIPELGQVL